MKHFKQIGLSALVGVFAFLAFNSTSLNISADSLKASVLSAFSRNTNVYNIARSKVNPEAFTFKYQFSKVKTKKGQSNFDLPIVPFDEKVAQKALERDYFPQGFGRVRDAWGYPVRENAYMKLGATKTKRQTFLDSFKTQKALAFDADANVPGLMNCRANTNVTGYFKAYFEDVALNNGVGYADATHGLARRTEACQVLQDIGTLLKLDTTTVTPDIIFMADPGNIPANALAAASSYFGYYSVGPDNGSLHKYIISHQDPTPGTGNFDALIITNFNGISWDVDSTLNANTYDFYTVMYHEVLHTLGFRGLLPSVISSTNDAHQHTTFDFNTYKDNTLANRFFNAATEFLQVPIGAPSAWFINNTDVYQGTKNIVGATPDGIRPVYSPSSWEQGSSLSHFDMARASGTTYVMNPSIGTNTTRIIHNDEKEVLCHEGYMVQGMSGCELPTPFAVDDNSLLSSPTSCISTIQNDIGSPNNIAMNFFSVLNAQPGDIINLYLSENCNTLLNTTTVTNTPTNIAISSARSLRLFPTNSPLPRIMMYALHDSISNRISNPAKVTLLGCNNNLSDYVCNGDFEMGSLQPIPTYNGWWAANSQFICYPGLFQSTNKVPWWCALNTYMPGNNAWSGSPDLVGKNLPQLPYSLWNLPYTVPIPPSPSIDMVDGGKYAAIVIDNSTDETITTQLRSPLNTGQQYTISFDVKLVQQSGYFSNYPVGTQTIEAVLDTQFITSTPEVIVSQIVPLNPVPWTHVTQTFIASQPFEFLSLHIIPTSSADGAYLDNISIIPGSGVITSNNSISGKVYSDQNSNGSLNTNETGLNGIQVGLFTQGSTTPLQTVTTQNIPHLGGYSFTNVPDGTYTIALLSESLYPTITEPLTNNPILISGYTHAKQITVTSGQTSANNNFGVVLASDLCTNLSGVQTTLPTGYSAVGTQCDACSNISGIQSNVPIGYVNINGQCILKPNDTVSVTDLCPNITGIQTSVPSGYQLVNGQCMKKLILSPTKVPTSTPSSPSVNTSR